MTAGELAGALAGGNARVADMGLARWLTPESMGVLTGETGTYLYMSPEMIRHELYNSRTDVFSWGVLLVELICQRPPYEDQHLTPIQASFKANLCHVAVASLPRACAVHVYHALFFDWCALYTIYNSTNSGQADMW